MKYIKYIALFLTVIVGLSYAQDAKEEVTPEKALKEQIASADTWEKAAAAEIAVSDFLKSNNDAAVKNQILLGLKSRYQALSRTDGIPVDWVYEVYTKYDPEFNSSDGSVSADYYYFHSTQPANREFVSNIRKATLKDFDSIVENFLKENTTPDRIASRVDSRSSFYAFIPVISDAAIKLGHPDALQWALMSYRVATNETSINNAVQRVASALKAIDFNLERANKWVEQQNGGEKVEFTSEELSLPVDADLIQDFRRGAYLTALAKGQFSQALDLAKQEYRSATKSEQIDRAIQNIGRVLMANDLSLVRYNAWVESQKNGQPFDLTLD